MLDFASNELMMDREKSPEHEIRPFGPEILESNLPKRNRKSFYLFFFSYCSRVVQLVWVLVAVPSKVI